jgi:ABC-2 type transport system ATP-binding protein
MAIVEVEGLYKKFKNTTAINNLKLEIEKGQLFGLIGPDGAGKTTFLRMLTGVLRPSAGEIILCSTDVVKHPEDIKEKIGVVPQAFSLYPDLTVDENLWFFSRMYNLSRDTFEERKKRLLQIARLEPFLKRRAEHLSGGMQKKLVLISSLLHTPEVLLLDEPTTGVDPVSRRELWAFLHELFVQGMTIIISTPYMDEAERCSCVAFLHRGEMLRIGNPLDIRRGYPTAVLELRHGDLFRLRSAIITERIKVQDIYPIADTLHVVVLKNELQRVKDFVRKTEKRTVVTVIKPTFEDTFIAMIKENP